jgi:hypothetical protein
MQMDERERQKRNALCSILESLQPGSKVTVDRFLHSWKHVAGIASTDEGMEICVRPEQDANAELPIVES